MSLNAPIADTSGRSKKIDGDLITTLEQKAHRLRCDILLMTESASSGHPGGALSAADILSVLYFHVMRHNPKDPQWPGRDRFVLSKGHAAPVLYAALAEAGYFSRDELCKLRRLGAMLQGHPDMRKVPGVDISTGSLGQGLAAANGMALALRMDKKDQRVYALLGDGECQEGSIWEAAMFAAHFRLSNVTAIIDFNGLQIDGPVAEVMNLAPLKDKWTSFGWKVWEVDGHDIPGLLEAFDASAHYKSGPQMIIANTIKGKGVSFMENMVDFHGKPPTEEQLMAALKELGCEESCWR